MRKALPRLRLYGLYSFVRFLRIAKIYAYKAKETLCQPYGQQSVLLCLYKASAYLK